jgi:7-cyano-7-deazaguanine synthase
MKNAIILCSGGLDSVVTTFFIKNKLEYDKIISLFFNYGQKSLEKEREFSKKCAEKVGAKFKEINLKELGELSTSLINIKGEVKEISKEDLKDSSDESAKWYVPARNTVFLSYALALAESLYVGKKEVSDIFVGFKCEGDESFPDTTKEFIGAVNNLAKIGFSYGFEIKAPLIEKDKEDVVLLGNELGIDFKNTFSCYVGNDLHCGVCLNCRLRQEGFKWANVEDPTDYSKK